ncbi:MAG: 5'/3'-nucleotidase SurE [Phycisphaerales bacterium]|nr:5'/3'-nucleotidase SurE [Phycisphaerales bacterium]
MQILLTNDDGIFAPGLIALHEALDGLGTITTIAPATVQSATSHGVTFHEPLMIETVTFRPGRTGVAVEGRPADCVKLAIRQLWQELHGPGSKPDLTISGMNSGANVGINIIYSGTVAAAVESAFLGVPAIAVSLHLGDRTKTCYERAAQIARVAIDRILEFPADPHEVVNVNVPRTESPDAPMPPIRIAEMNTASDAGGYERRESPGGHVYYWANGSGLDFTHTAPGSDVETLLSRHVVVTPLNYDVTDHARLQTWRDRLE